MTIERFDELRKACKDFCNVRYRGCRQQRDCANAMLKDSIKCERERKGNSAFIVYERNFNHGTRNFPDIEHELIVAKLKDLQETDKSFVEHCGSHKTIISKDKIVAWLS